MATVTVVNDNIGGHLEVYYSFSANVSARTWSLYSELRLVIPSGATYGAWNATGTHSGNLVGNGIGSLGGGTHTLDSYSTSGNYNSNGDAPSVNISWAFNVRSSWAGYWDNYGSITATGSSIGPDGTPPTGLTATLGTVGPDWAEITTSVSSYGSPSTSANRYIDAAILGSSSYDNPYKYKTKKAVKTNTFTIDNSSSGNLTIVPNTQYHYGGYASNTVRSVSTVTGTFVTLPAKPTLTAVDQGHGQIDFTVSHTTEGSAKTVTEEYSTDSGTTWTTIAGGAFTLTLSTQTEVIVRRISDAGESSETITVTPVFTNGIYASVNRVSTVVEHIYAPTDGYRRLAGISYDPSELEGTFFASFNENVFIEKANSDATLRQADIDGATITQISVYFARANDSGIAGIISINFVDGGGVSDTYRPWGDSAPANTAITTSRMAEWGLTVDFSDAPPDISQTQSIPLTSTYSTGLGTTKISKVYASVDGKSALEFEDAS